MPLVKFYATLRRLTGLKEKTVEGSNLSQVMASLTRDYPPLAAYLQGSARGRLIITLNGHPLDPAAGLDIPLSDGDLIALFPPISGG